MQSLFRNNEGVPVNNFDVTTTLRSTDVSNDLTNPYDLLEQTSIAPIQDINADVLINDYNLDDYPNNLHSTTIEMTPLLSNATWMTGTSGFTRSDAEIRFIYFVFDLHRKNIGIVKSGPTTYTVDDGAELMIREYFHLKRFDGRLEIFMGNPVTLKTPFKDMIEEYTNSIMHPVLRPLLSSFTYPNFFVILIKEGPENVLNTRMFNDTVAFLQSPSLTNINFETRDTSKTYELRYITFNCPTYIVHLYRDSTEKSINEVRNWASSGGVEVNNMIYELVN